MLSWAFRTTPGDPQVDRTEVMERDHGIQGSLVPRQALELNGESRMLSWAVRTTLGDPQADRTEVLKRDHGIQGSLVPIEVLVRNHECTIKVGTILARASCPTTKLLVLLRIMNCGHIARIFHTKKGLKFWWTIERKATVAYLFSNTSYPELSLLMQLVIYFPQLIPW